MDFNPNALEYGKYRYSYSKLSTGACCPRRYHKQYIHKEKPSNIVDAPMAQIGIAVHSILEIAFKTMVTVGLDITRCDEALQDAYNKVLEKEKYTSFEWEMIHSHQNGARDKLRRLCTFAKNNNCHLFVESELAIDSKFNPVAFGGSSFFNGKLDLALLKPNGDLAIIDHKTGKKSTGYTQQLAIYEVLAYFSLAKKAEELGCPIKTTRTCLNYLSDDQMIWFPAITVGELLEKRLPLFIEWLNTTADFISTGEAKKGDHCKYCCYKSSCWAEQGWGRKGGGRPKKEKSIEV